MEAPLPDVIKDFGIQPDPVCASTLASNEATLQDRLARFQPIQYGCKELDGIVLLGGLQRGSVVGVSADNTDGFGLLVRFASSSPVLDAEVVRWDCKAQ